MSKRQIILRDGPCDGRTAWWEGGDEYECAPSAKHFSFAAFSDPERCQENAERHNYRRTRDVEAGQIVFRYVP